MKISIHHNFEFPLSSIRNNCVLMLEFPFYGASFEKSFNRHARLHSNKYSICVVYNDVFVTSFKKMANRDWKKFVVTHIRNSTLISHSH